MIVYLGLGSNMGDRMKYLEAARNLLNAREIEILKTSRAYETEPFSKEDGSTWFLNQAVEVRTDLSPQALLKATQEIERHVGRDAAQHPGSRCIDIDILLYGDLVVDLPELQIPHASLSQRRFALVPLLEIAPVLKDPISRESFRSLLSRCKDGHKVIPFL
ncbi:2-amino-4-hydroxy-6-hydroxymethyldihydropteridine diphosphokinase [Candidatus Peregrinibacteria bacterium]|nr:2-amino-4-hydroxy-6-hydroxymethyldihydropteridine diphosphokinase [Candidatus Peregrinibacteria bacterium]